MTTQGSSAARDDQNMRIEQLGDSPVVWHDPREASFRLSGLPWFARDGRYRRLPLTPAETLPEAVDRLANCTAGVQLAFRSDSPLVAVEVTLDGRADMAHMAATGQCGFDLYMGRPGALRFVGVSRYDHSQDHYAAPLLQRAEGDMQGFVLNFPLYRGVRSLRVGLSPGATLETPEPFAQRPGRIVIYGTSIAQGGCAARPGMAYTNILSRRLNAELVNLGFSGNGRGEAHVIRTIAEIDDVDLFVLDYEANAMGLETYSRTLPEAIAILRRTHPDTPVLVISRISFARDLYNAEAARQRRAGLAMQADLVAALRAAGDAQVHYLDGSRMLGEDFDECTVDGVHPTDLGFHRMANAVAAKIAEIFHQPA